MRLDLVEPDLKRHVDNKVANKAKCQWSPAEFKVGDKVAVRDYRNLTGVRWEKGVVLSRMSKFMYKVKVASDVILIRHFDQMLPGSRFPMLEYDNDNFRATDDINDDLKLCSDNVQLNVSTSTSENVAVSNSQHHSESESDKECDTDPCRAETSNAENAGRRYPLRDRRPPKRYVPC